MGYYSIYKIIKDIIKTIFGRKVWKYTLIILIAFIVFFIMGVKGVFATSSDFYINTEFGDIKLPNWIVESDYNWAFSISPISGSQLYNFAFVVSDSNIYSYNGGTYYSYLQGTSTSNIRNFAYKNNGGADFSTIKNSIENSVADYRYNSCYLTSATFNYQTLTNTDILSFVDGSVFFSANVSMQKNPSFYNKENFVDFSADSLIIYPNDYGITDTLYLHMLTVDSTVSDDSNTYYYYSQRVFALNNNNKYFGIINTVNYYNIPRYVFSLEANKKYIFFLSDSDTSINNSVGLYDYSNDFDGFVLEPTTEQMPIGNTITDNQQKQNDKLNNIDNLLNNDSVDDNTNDDIDNSLNKDTTTDSDMLVTSFFTRLADIITNLADYNLQEDTQIILPVPFTSGSIVLHSNYLYTYLSSAFKVIIQGFWYYLFGFYIFKFVNKIYISIKSGNILDGVSSSDEIITNDML